MELNDYIKTAICPVCAGSLIISGKVLGGRPEAVCQKCDAEWLVEPVTIPIKKWRRTIGYKKQFTLSAC